MDENERNLFDLYAGLAMLGLLFNHINPRDVPKMAVDLAQEMLDERNKRN